MSNSVGGCDPVEGGRSKRRSRKRSEVWDHFKETPDHKRAICKYCSISMSAESKAGTTHLKRHLESCPKRRQDEHQPVTIMGIRDEVRKFGSTNENTLDAEVKKAIVAEIPFAPSDCKKTYSRLMGLMDVDKEICSYYEREKEKLANEFNYLTSRVCFSYEIMRELNYISITAHFINEEFNLVKKLIGFKKLPADISSKSCVVDTIEKCISDWKLGDKIFSFTGKNYDKYLSESVGECFPPKMLLEGTYFHVSCIKEDLAQCYSCNIGLFSSSKNAKNINNFIKAGQAVRCHMEIFNQIAKDRGLPPINEDWLNQYAEISWDLDSDECPDLEQLEPALKMLKEAIPYKDVFSQYAKINSVSIPIVNNRNLRDISINWERLLYDIDIDWETAETLVKLYDKFHEIIDRMATFNYPTSNLFCQILAEIQDDIVSNKFRPLPIGQIIFAYFEVENHNQLFYSACALDPRFKLILLKYFFEKRERPESTEERINEIREGLEEYYGAYVKGKTNEFGNPQEGTSNSTRESNQITHRFSMYSKELKKKTQKSELEEYLNAELVDLDDASFNLLDWWKENGSRYPVLSRMARDFLATPTCVYSIKGNISSDFGVLKGASPQLVEAVICSKDWILSDVQSISESMETAGGGGA